MEIFTTIYSHLRPDSTVLRKTFFYFIYIKTDVALYVCYKLQNLFQCINELGNHSFSTYAKFSEKLSVLTPLHAYVPVRIMG